MPAIYGTKICLYCGVAFNRGKSADLKKWQGRKYCSQRCSGLGQPKRPPASETMAARVCPVCGKDFRPHKGEDPCMFNKRKTCGKVCGYASRRKPALTA